MHPFAVLGDPVRRRIVEVLAGGELASGESIDAWLQHYRAFWSDALDGLAEEIERGKAERSLASDRAGDS